MRILLLALATAGLASAQFGNANINWGSEAPAVVVNNEEPLRDVKPSPQGIRQSGLTGLNADELELILQGFGLERLGSTTAHMVSQIRAACLGLAPKGLKAQLAKRGLRCDGCQHREAYLDRLLDSVHLAPKR